ncbi:MAG: hypothetical protein FWG89_05960 [Treponema sp.]|nr:hypothetical protein [Treponema sp.]
MADLQFNVDTSPMAASVDTARGHINGVTVAVTAMEAAVISAERTSSKTICENVDNGFYMLVKSQISQKAVAAYSEMTSKQMTLMQMAKALEGIKRQMEGDYGMITRRYAKLFQSLNKALETRVRELDRPAMHLADIKKSIVFDKLKDDSSMLFSISTESLPVAQTALSGKLKQKTREAMLTLGDSIDENNSFSKIVDSILVPSSDGITPANSDFRFLPVIFSSIDSLLDSGGHIDNVYTADSWQNTAPVVYQVSQMQGNLPWIPVHTEEKETIRREFVALCESDSEERITGEMLRLFDESVWEALQK